MNRDEMEARRLRAVTLFEMGLRCFEVAKAEGVSRTTASRWSHALQSGGAQAMKRRKAPGRPPKLDIDALASELRAMHAAADRFGRTTLGFSVLIFERYGVSYDRDHVSRIMKRLGIGRRRNVRASVSNMQPFAAISEERMVVNA